MSESKPVICMGDTTTHGGTVMEGFQTYSVNGKLIAGLGHQVNCPQCKGSFPIVEGVGSFLAGGVPVALAGMKTACGAELIASQNVLLVGSYVKKEFFDEQVQALGENGPLTNYPFLIEIADGRRFCGYTFVNGSLPRISTDDDSEEYTVYWGDEALAKRDGV